MTQCASSVYTTKHTSCVVKASDPSLDVRSFLTFWVLLSADIHSLLADIGMEQENFESALQDHRRALQLLDGTLQVGMINSMLGLHAC